MRVITGCILSQMMACEKYKPGLGQHGWIIRDVRETSPDIEAATGFQDASDVAEPGFEQPIELFVRNEVIGQRPVLGSHLLRAVLGLALAGLERAVAGSDRVLAAGFDLHVVRRIRIAKLNLRAGEQSIEVFDAGRVAAQKPVVAKNPKVARLRDSIVGRFWHIIGIGQPRFNAWIK